MILVMSCFSLAISQPSHVCTLDSVVAGAVACPNRHESVAIAEGDMAENADVPLVETASGNFAAAMFTV